MGNYNSPYKIPLKYGVDQCIGDTLGPGGIFRALRSIPVTLELAKDMEALCPNALLLNYVNPMAMICWVLGETNVNFVGLCHGVQTTLDLVSGYVGVPKAQIDFLCAGINHMGWFLKLEKDGQDLYPLLRERFEQPEYYVNEKVRGEVFRQFGYFMTESTGHLSEYLPWFRSSQKALNLYCDEPAFGGESRASLNWSQAVLSKFEGEDMLATTGDPEAIVHACALEPLTSTKMTLKEIRDMVGEMIEAEKLWLPQFEGKSLKSTPIISIPKDIKRAKVPMDPALAILARFEELLK